MARTAAALVIGNELLSGKVKDENTYELARTLRRLGIEFRRMVSVLDDIDTIAREVKSLADTHDYVFTSGGVGPTHDDVTMESVAKGFGVEAKLHPELEAMIRAHYGDKVKEGHLRMAIVPEGSKLHVTEEIRWPVIVKENVWILPGVPEIFRMKLRVAEGVLGTDQPYLSRAVYTNLDEGTLKPWLDTVVAKHPTVDVGSYPTFSDIGYRTKLTFDGKDHTAVDACKNAFVALLPEGEPQREE
jgi:molybdenum cofactor synthesis domain-containing protein